MNLILHQFKTDARHFRWRLVVLWLSFATETVLTGIHSLSGVGVGLSHFLIELWQAFFALALVASLVFSLVYAAVAAKSRQGEKILIPILDILQSVPILGFLSITVTGFIALFPGRLLGVECAAIFAIFTSQAWNMTFSVYQSLRTVPAELIEAARMYHLSPWKRFWRLEVPHAIPSLVWNMMMSVSGGWFFVVASEAITVAGQTIMLPGIGSYIATAINQRDLAAIGYAVLVMFVVILLYDQLLFRPLLAWSRKFRADPLADEDNVRPWFFIVLQRARLFDLVQGGVLELNRIIDDALAGLAARVVLHEASRRGVDPLETSTGSPTSRT